MPEKNELILPVETQEKARFDEYDCWYDSGLYIFSNGDRVSIRRYFDQPDNIPTFVKYGHEDQIVIDPPPEKPRTKEVAVMAGYFVWLDNMEPEQRARYFSWVESNIR